jgi:hypothetical protein
MHYCVRLCLLFLLLRIFCTQLDGMYKILTLRIYTLIYLTPVLLCHSHFDPRLRSSVDVYTFPHLRGFVCSA